jgi:hypothetical protein
MRSPGATRFGRRHANDHLGLPSLDRERRAAFSAGWKVVLAAMGQLAESGVTLLGGSGAPALGVCPGVGLLEERRAWNAAELPVDVVASAFAARTALHEVPA